MNAKIHNKRLFSFCCSVIKLLIILNLSRNNRAIKRNLNITTTTIIIIITITIVIVITTKLNKNPLELVSYARTFKLGKKTAN